MVFRFVMLAALMCLLLTSRAAISAGFDCKNAITPVEFLICADYELSLLDEEMSEMFSVAKGADINVAGDQRKWIKEYRNTCPTPSCLKAAYEKRIGQLSEIKVPCPVSDKSLTGAWLRIKGGESFEEMLFAVSSGGHEFISWLHGHPDVVGTWSLQDCHLRIQHKTEEKLQYELLVTRFEKNKLHAIDMDNRGVAVYRRAE